LWLEQQTGNARVWRYRELYSVCIKILTLSPRKAEKPASPTATNSRKPEIPAYRSLVYSCKAEMSAWKFRKITVINNVVSGSSGSGDPMLWELWGGRVKTGLEM